MGGARLSNRCDYCKKRKIKCDQNWPTCGACARTGRTCSGPPKFFSGFVSTGQASFAATHRAKSAATSPDNDDESNTIDPSSPSKSDDALSSSGSQPSTPPHPVAAGPLVIRKRRPAANGQGAYLVLKASGSARTVAGPSSSTSPPRPSSQSPPPSVPGTPEDLLVLQLGQRILEVVGSDDDICLRIPWIAQVLPRLDHSPVLFESTSLYLSAWNSQCRDPSSGPWIDRRIYARALSGLNAALGDPVASRTPETLAAAALVQRVGFDYDLGARTANEDRHAAGVAALMTARGPPKLDDDLDVGLTFTNLGSLLLYLLSVPTANNFFTRPEWFGALSAVADRFRGSAASDSASPVPTTPTPYRTAGDLTLRRVYGLWLQLAILPDLTHGMRALSPVHPDRAVLESLAARAEAVADELRAFDRLCIIPMLANGRVRYLPDPDAVDGHRYEFDNHYDSLLFYNHAMACILVRRILQHMLVLAGVAVGPAGRRIEASILGWSRRIWQTLPWILGRSRSVADGFIAPLLFSFESATDPALQRYLIDKMVVVCGPRSRYISERPVDDFMGICRGLTGRP